MKVPPFVREAPRALGDTGSYAGALRLAGIIRDAWARCGHDVPTEILPLAPGNSQTTYVVRMPTLVNGLPVRTP